MFLSAVCPRRLSLDLGLKSHSKDVLEKPGIQPTTPGLQGGKLYHYTTEAFWGKISILKKKVGMILKFKKNSMYVGTSLEEPR